MVKVMGPGEGRSGKSRIVRRVQHLISWAILVAVVGYVWAQRDSFVRLLDLSLPRLAAMVTLVFAVWLVASLQSFVLYRAEGRTISYRENFWLTCATNFANYAPFRAGTLLRARYMKRCHGLNYARTGSLFTIRVVLMLLTTGLAGLVGVVGLWQANDHLSLNLLLLCIGLVSGALVAVLVPLPNFAAESGRFARVWNDFSEGFHAVRSRPGLSVAFTGLMLVHYALLGVRLDLAFHSVGIDAPVFALVTLAPLLSLVTFLAFVPGGLGLREALLAYLSHATGTEFGPGMFAATLDRGVMLALTLTLGALGYFRVWLKLRHADSQGDADRGTVQRT